MNEDKMEEHHIHPKFMDNPKGKGRKYNIPKKDHTILHMIIPSIIWKFVSKDLKKACINKVISFSEYYIKKVIWKKNQRLDKKINIEISKEIMSYAIKNGFLIKKNALDYMIKKRDVIDYKKLIFMHNIYFEGVKLISKKHLVELFEEYEVMQK